jgi:adhesin transport system outer membrane protein
MSAFIFSIPLPGNFRRLSAVVGLALWPLISQAYCEDPADIPLGGKAIPESIPTKAAEVASLPAYEIGKDQLTGLMRLAVAESREVRGAENGRAAAQFDLQQVRANAKPQLSLNSSAGLGQTDTPNTTYGVGAVDSVALSLSASLYDGGRQTALTRYREYLAGASMAGAGSVRERVVSEAVLAVLDRNRFRIQVKVHQQMVSKLTCLAQAVDKIVQADPGRASEQIQARKSLRQAEISQDEALASLRQADIRLQRIFGDKDAPWAAVGVPLIEMPALEDALAFVQASPDIDQLRQQADALDQLARATAAERSPQVRWQAGINSARQTHVVNSSWNAGLSLSYVLADGGGADAAANAAQERATAARRNWEQALNDRTRQAGIYHDAAHSAYQRARRYSDLLRDSDALRNATYEQWIKLGRRSLFDLISAESEHYQVRLSYVNALHDGYTASAQLRHIGEGLLPWVAPDLVVPVPR